MQFSMQSLLISFLIKGLVLCKIDGSSRFNASFQNHLPIRLMSIFVPISIMKLGQNMLKGLFHIAARFSFWHKLWEELIKKYIFIFCPINAVKRGETWLISCHGPKYAFFGLVSSFDKCLLIMMKRRNLFKSINSYKSR